MRSRNKYLGAADTVENIPIRRVMGRNSHSGQTEKPLWKQTTATVGRDNCYRQQKWLFMTQTILVGSRDSLLGKQVQSPEAERHMGSVFGSE